VREARTLNQPSPLTAHTNVERAKPNKSKPETTVGWILQLL